MAFSTKALLSNNRNWAASMKRKNKNFFEDLAAKQSPEYLWIGCSDSRIPPNEVTKTGPGEMFIHRNVANLIVHTDMNLMSVLQYAVEILKVKHVIVCGHYGCGGVMSSMQNASHGLIDKWLRNIKDVYRLHRKELNLIDPTARANRLVELNVIEQVYNLYKTSIIQRAWLKTPNTPELHGWIYDMHSGLLHDLQVNPKDAYAEEFDQIYRIDFPDINAVAGTKPVEKSAALGNGIAGTGKIRIEPLPKKK